MKKMALALGASILGLAAPAMAEDGFYAGFGASYTENDRTATQRVAPTSGGGWFAANNRAAINAAAADDVSSNVAGAFLFAGYQRHVSGGLTLGVEADLNVFDGDETDTYTLAYPTAPGTFIISQNVTQSWMSTLRLRGGYDVTENVNVFLSAGVAFSEVQLTTSFQDNYPPNQTIPQQFAEGHEFNSGAVYGAGLDWSFANGSALRVEYLHAELGTVDNSRALTYNTGSSALNEVLRSAVDVNADVVRVGLSWSFGS